MGIAVLATSYRRRYFCAVTIDILWPGFRGGRSGGPNLAGIGGADTAPRIKNMPAAGRVAGQSPERRPVRRHCQLLQHRRRRLP